MVTKKTKTTNKPKEPTSKKGRPTFVDGSSTPIKFEKGGKLKKK